MEHALEVQGIIFDMDNTLLCSKIDFDAMKQETFDFLVQQGIFPCDYPVHEHTTSSIIIQAQHSPIFTEDIKKSVWDIVVKYEMKGMAGAHLEAGVESTLDYLYPKCRLVVLTNNSKTAAEAALKKTGIDHYFDHIVGREQMAFLKPSPSGIQYILALYKDIPATRWLSIGDSWIDGKASQDGGVQFLAYQGDSAKMKSKGVYPIGFINHMSELLQFLTS
jgi:phosphoglycolate phosphatase